MPRCAGLTALLLALSLMPWAGVRAQVVAPAADELWLATGSTLTRLAADGSRQRQPLPASLRTPLGSSWKLFVYLYLSGQELRPPDYQCRGQNAEEVFCCNPGEHIDAERALARSCAPYFDVQRLQLQAADWRRYWQQQAAPAWLLQLDALQPGREVLVSELLAALRSAPPAAARQAQAALLGVTLEGRAAGSVRHFGSGVRVKTWTWDRPDRPREKMGGAAGWLADGSVLWLAGEGSSTRVLNRWARGLAPLLQRPVQPLFSQPCVQVRLFARYAIASVHDARGKPVAEGALHGVHRVQFRRGTSIKLEAQGELQLLRQQGRWQLLARMDLNDYVARVLQREAAAEPVQAARALAIAARSYLLQNAAHAGGCYVMDDSSDYQRVLPQQAGAAARAVAAWTDGLILHGQPVMYHRDQSRPGQMGWQQALAQAAAGADFTDILARHFPKARLASLYAPDSSQCQPWPQGQAWLQNQLPHWRRQLQGEAGFEPPARFSVCRLAGGRPQVDLQRGRLYVAGDLQLDGRLSLAHEWLHLAFAWHPHGRDEIFIEQWARRLLALPEDWN